MITTILSVLIGIFILGIMVLIHEGGHFIAAKACGFRVLAFSIGFGRAIVKTTIGDTEYRISAIPFGGYVKMAGEQPDEQTGAPDEFTAKPKWQRAVVAIAGPLANYLSAILMLWIMFMYGVEHPRYFDRPVLGFVTDSSAAKDAGLMAGDSVVSMNGAAVHSWDDFEDQFMTGSRVYVLHIVRNGVVRDLTIKTDPAKGEQYSQPPFGMLPMLPPVVGRTTDAMPAEKAGIKRGDTVVAIDSIAICSWYQISTVLRNSAAGATHRIAVRRDGATLLFDIVPYFDTTIGHPLLGIEMGKPATRLARYAFAPAFDHCLDRTWSFTTMIFDVLKKLVSREVSASELSGPVGIIPASGIIALQGLSPILNFMALISVNLAVLNLFPLIITDGGLLMFLLLEAIRRKPLSIKTQLAINRGAIIFFILFFAYVTMNDIHRLPDLFRMFGK